MSDLDTTSYFQNILSFINDPQKKQLAITHFQEQNKTPQSGSINEKELKELYKNELIKDGIIDEMDVYLSDIESVESNEEVFEESKNNEFENDSDSDYDTDSEDEIRKLENSINKDILIDYHPEIKQINHNEVITLSKIVKDKNGVPIDPLHKTVPFLTKYEKARILGLRAKQINSGSDVFVEVPSNIFDGYTIAQMELEEKKIPFIIKRPLPNGSSEFWHVSDLQ
jgi:DNA-directed RNA polymerase I, II, and III subunit RPABC2